ncbi:MAG: anti-sigma factor domain-containing protein [Clostridium butyricum]|nr:anti-sigma factor domain-containing protein [Clostridium butyricum]
MERLDFNKNKYVFTSIPTMTLLSRNSNIDYTKEMSAFLSELRSYNVIFKDLFTHKLDEDNRNIVLNLAYYLLEDEKLNEKLVRRKKVPVKELSIATKIGRSNIEDWNEYIIAYYIILSNPNYKCIQDHLKIKLKDEDNVLSIVNKKYPINKGVAIKISKRNAYIVTSSGEFLKIRTNNEVYPGNVCEGKSYSIASKLKIPVALTLVVLLFIACATIVEFRRTESIILINTTSKVKLHINKFHKVIYTYSSTEKGQHLIDSINIENNNVDDSIAKVFQYAIDNDMVDKSTQTLITITGKPIEYGSLPETNKVISENKIPIVINNCGSQQKLPEYNSSSE